MIPNLIVILGPTASGKTALAASLAYQMHTEIISADSRQVYSGMNLGTGKDYEAYLVNGKKIPYHLIDIVSAGEKYHVFQYKQDFLAAFESIQLKHKLPILCGGSALYIDAVLNDFEYTAIPPNETLRANIQHKTKTELLDYFASLPITKYNSLADTSTSKRLIRAIEIITFLNQESFAKPHYPKLVPIIIGLKSTVELRRNRIEDRLVQRLQNGLIEEVTELMQKLTPEQLIYYGLEYKFITQFLLKQMTYDALIYHLTIAIQQFAKRQMTYFRKMEREGKNIHWIDATLPLSLQLDEANKISQNKMQVKE